MLTVLTADGGINRRNGSGWTTMNGQATDIGVGANNQMCAIGYAPPVGPQGNYGIFCLNSDQQTYTQLPGYGYRIAISPDGLPWVLNDSRPESQYLEWFLMESDGRTRLRYRGSDGQPWIIGSGGFAYKWTGSFWYPVGSRGGAQAIAISPEGTPWVAGGDGNVYVYR